MCGSKKWVDTGARRQGSNICCEVKNKLKFFIAKCNWNPFRME